MTKKSESKDLVNWEQELAQQAKEVAKLERPTTNKISLRSGIMSYMDQPMPNNQLECIIAMGVHENVFYSQPFDPDVVYPPDCFALSTNGISMIPHPDVPNPVHPQCQGCPNLEFKSARNKKGKACSQRRRLAILPALSNPEEITTAEIATLSLPVMSVKNWANHVNRVAAQYQRPPWGVVSLIKVVPDQKTQFRVTFDVVRTLENEFLPHVHGRLEMAESILMTPYDMSPPEQKPEETAQKF